MASSTSNSFHYFVRLSVIDSPLGKKRSADEAGVATREDGAKRRESTGSGKDVKGGLKVRLSSSLGRLRLVMDRWTPHISYRPTQAGAIPDSDFKARAVPLHVAVTRTPPAARDDIGASPAPVDDAELLGAVALQPCSFTAGSYGWKGSKRLAIDLVDPASGEQKKVQVMLTYVFSIIEFSPHTYCNPMDSIIELMRLLWVASGQLKRKRKLRLTTIVGLLGPRSGYRNARVRVLG